MSQSRSSIIVTGGAGYIGSHACKALKQAGYEPIVIDDLSRGQRHAVRWGPLEEINILDLASMILAFKKYQPVAVLHFAGPTYVDESIARPDFYYKNNVQGALSLLQAMRETGCTRLVFSSSCTVYGFPQKVPISENHPLAPISPYGRTKKIVEEILYDHDYAYGIKSICLRYFNAAGADPDGELGENHDPETHALPLCILAALGKKQQFTIFGSDYPTDDGSCVRDYIHVTDLAEAHVAALNHLLTHSESKTFNLGNGRGYSVKELVKTVERVTALKVPVILGPRRPGDPPALVADSQRARDHLSWTPRWGELEQQVLHAWKWLSKPTDSVP